MTESPEADDQPCGADPDERARQASELEDGSLDPDELEAEPDWWDEGSDDED